MTLLCSAISVTSLMKLNHLSRTSIQKIEDHLNIASESVSVFRASIFIITSICILAVDFPVFPRRFAKTETYGYGLMDLGVGLFVVANAVTSREARQIKFMSRYVVVELHLRFSTCTAIASNKYRILYIYRLSN